MSAGIAVFFLLCMGFYAGYLLLNFYYFRFGFQGGQPNAITDNQLPSVTVIIPARNEEHQIGNLLEDLGAQEYPAELLTVVVMDDHSTDGTATICEEKMAERPGWKVLAVERPLGSAYKKAAISQGIQSSEGSIIVTTDADCRAGSRWIRTLVDGFDSQTGLVSGPVCMWDNGSWFEQFQALEFCGLIAIGAGSMQRGAPNMCNGANLAYRREVFEQVKGFEGIDHIASGDDELLMHKIHSMTPYSVRFQKHREAIVRTAPCSSFSQFVHQRIRWVSKSTHYKNRSITLTMSIIYLAVLGIPVTGALVLAGMWSAWGWWALMGLKLIPEFLILHASCHFFNRKQLLYWFLPEQMVHVPYILWAGMAGNIGKYQWKGRQVS